MLQGDIVKYQVDFVRQPTCLSHLINLTGSQWSPQNIQLENALSSMMGKWRDQINTRKGRHLTLCYLYKLLEEMADVATCLYVFYSQLWQRLLELPLICCLHDFKFDDQNNISLKLKTILSMWLWCLSDNMEYNIWINFLIQALELLQYLSSHLNTAAF